MKKEYESKLEFKGHQYPERQGICKTSETIFSIFSNSQILSLSKTSSNSDRTPNSKNQFFDNYKAHTIQPNKQIEKLKPTKNPCVYMNKTIKESNNKLLLNVK